MQVWKVYLSRVSLSPVFINLLFYPLKNLRKQQFLCREGFLFSKSYLKYCNQIDFIDGFVYFFLFFSFLSVFLESTVFEIPR